MKAPLQRIQRVALRSGRRVGEVSGWLALGELSRRIDDVATGVRENKLLDDPLREDLAEIEEVCRRVAAARRGQRGQHGHRGPRVAGREMDHGDGAD